MHFTLRSPKLAHVLALFLIPVQALSMAPAQTTLADPVSSLTQKPDQPQAPHLSTLPLAFVPNAGQVSQKVRFLTQSMGGSVFFSADDRPNPNL